MKTTGYILGAVTGIALLLWFQNKKKKRKVQLPLNLLDFSSFDDFVKEDPAAVPKRAKKQTLGKTVTKVSTTQVTLTNHTDTTRTLQLWAGNTDTPITPITDQDRIRSATEAQEEFTIPIGIDPQGMVYNPFNGYIYVANQLSNTVSVINGTELVSTIELGDFRSPVALAVNTLENSPNYGKVYVVNSVADTVSIIGTDFEIETSIAVGIRPAAVAFNPVNERLYVSSVADGILSVIDTNTVEVINTLDVAEEPRGVAVDNITGNIYVSATGGNRVYVFDRDDTSVTLLRLNNRPTGLLVLPELDTVYVVSSGNNTVLAYSTLTNDTINSAVVGNDPYAIAYHRELNVLYVTNREDSSITILDTDLNILGLINNIEVGTGLVYNPSTGDIISASNTGIQGLRFALRNPVSVNDGYYATVEEFQYNPAKIKHLKMVFSTQDIAGVLRVGYASVNGQQEQEAIALNEFTHPQNRNNSIREITALNKTIIDGKTRWSFDIAPNQRITLLLDYQQWKRKEIINPILPTNYELN